MWTTIVTRIPPVNKGVVKLLTGPVNENCPVNRSVAKTWSFTVSMFTDTPPALATLK